ncbi:hypothetical protein D3C80_1639600 [compost metagenome]
MSNSILEQLYFGEIRPEEVIVPKNPEYRALNKKISISKEYFKNILSENDFKLFEETFDLSGESCSMHSTEAFIYGFKMGALMMGEVLGERE